MEYLGKQLVFAIAQQSFEAGENLFSTLRPLATLDCEPVDSRDFPNRGLAWWMVRGLDLQTAPPGRLIVGTLEHAQASSSDPDKDVFQVALQSAKIAGPRAIIEVLDLPARWTDPLAIISSATCITDHPPTPLVLVRMGSALFGPFKSNATPISGETGRYVVRFGKQVPDRPIYRLPSASIASRELTAEVSMEARAPNRTSQLARCRYELASWEVFEAACQRAETVDLVTDEEIVRRAARRVLTKARTNELLTTLREVQSGLAEAGEQDELERLTGLIARQEIQGDALDELVGAVVRADVLKPRLESEISRAVGEAIQSRASTIRAQAEVELKQVRAELDAARSELGRVSDDIASNRRRALAHLDQEMASRRAEAEAGVEALRREQQMIEGSMSSAVERFRSGREQAVADFLVLQPLMEALGIGGGSENNYGQDASLARSRSAASISLPAAFAAEGPQRDPLEEEAFFQRLVDHVEACGFNYERRDLVAYHLSTKVSDLSILGGVSGTGKSSLPRLYTHALAGDETAGADRFLPVDVSPAWTNPGDLLGYVNLLSSSFTPSPAGLFTRLAEASLEYDKKGAASGIYVVCLDEMNLAQVEHYGSSLIQALSRDPAERAISVFDMNAVAADDPFRHWWRLPLRESVRFVGTINFDETTRRISRRLLDRANLIQLRARHLADLDRTGATSSAQARGPAVTLREFKAWTTYRPLPSTAAQLFEAMQGSLAALGCPLTARRQSAIATFLASAERLCSSTEALDMQITDRILPQISGTFRPGARQAIEALEAAISAHAPACEMAREALSEVLDAEIIESADQWDVSEA